MKRWTSMMATAAVAICLASFDLNAQGSEYDWSGGAAGWNTDNWSGGAPYANANETGNINSNNIVYAAPGTEFVGRLNLNAGGTLRYNSGNGAGPICTNLHANGGTFAPWTGNAPLQGRIYVNALSFLASGGIGIASGISGNGDLQKTGSGTLSGCSWDASAWTGRLIVSEGIVRVQDAASLNLGTHEIIVAAGCEWGLWVPPSGGWKIGNSFLGSGRLSTIRADALTLQGATIRPGDTADGPAVGTLSVRNNENYNLSLVFDLNGTNRCHIVIDVTGEGGVAGEDYDQLFADHAGAYSQHIALGAGKTDLTVNFHGKLNLKGQTLTVVKADNGTLTGAFETVTLHPSDWRATVNCNDDSVTLTDVYRITRGTVILFR